MAEQTHEVMESLVAPLVLGAAEPEEAELVLNHLSVCASCRELERRLRQAADLLPLAAEPGAPPADLRARVLAAAGAPPFTGTLTRLRLPRLPRPPRPQLRGLQAAVAVLALAVVGLAVWDTQLAVQLHQARTAVANYSLEPTSPSLAGSSGRVIALRNQGLVLVDFQHMPEPEPGRVYEVWLGTPQGRMVPAGVFRPDPDGSKLLVLNRNVSGYSVIALTVEPGPSGSAAPSQAPQMMGTLQ